MSPYLTVLIGKINFLPSDLFALFIHMLAEEQKKSMEHWAYIAIWQYMNIWPETVSAWSNIPSLDCFGKKDEFQWSFQLNLFKPFSLSTHGLRILLLVQVHTGQKCPTLIYSGSAIPIVSYRLLIRHGIKWSSEKSPLSMDLGPLTKLQIK